MSQEFQTGLIQGWTDEQYHGRKDIVSKSHLDMVAPECDHTPLHYWDRYIRGPGDGKGVVPVDVRPKEEVAEESKALADGKAIHAAVLEPDVFRSRYILPPEEAPKRPLKRSLEAKNPRDEVLAAKEWWDAYDAQNAGRIVVEPDDMEMFLGMRDAVYSHPVAKLLFTGGKAEQTFMTIDPETGEKIKCRPDYEKLETHGWMVDLKSTICASPDSFGNSATKWRYDVQGEWYPDVIHTEFGPGIVEQFLFVAVEKKKPHAIGIYYALPPGEDLDARTMMRRDLRQIAECRASGVWPDWGMEFQPLKINDYRRRHLRPKPLRRY